MKPRNRLKLKIDHLTTGYSGHTVSSDLTATLPEGQVTCLIGPNGSGKSTLLKTLSGALPALGGSVTETNSKTLSIVLTHRPDALGLTAWDVVAMGRQPYTGFFGKLSNQDNNIIHESMQQLNVADIATRRIITLSDGQLQKVMIAKALAQQTPIILLDEPSAFLDFPSKVQLMLLLRDIAHLQGKTILLSTHDISLATKLSDNLWMMTPDGTLNTGTPQDLSDSGALAALLGESAKYM